MSGAAAEPGAGAGVLAPREGGRAHSVYVAAAGPHSGKSVVALGLMELLSARLERVGFFRPVVAGDEPDGQIELIRRRYAPDAGHEEMRGVSVHEVLAEGAGEEVSKRVVAAFRELERRFEAVVCEGVDAAAGLDLDLDARLANDLGCPVLGVVRAGTAEETVASIRMAREALERRGCDVLAMVAARVPPQALLQLAGRLAEDRRPVYLLAEDDELACPTVGEIAAALEARPRSGDAAGIDREVRAVRIAAMSAEHFLDDLVDGTLVIVPGDRADVLLACLASARDPSIPGVAGVVLTAGLAPGASVGRLLDAAPFPVFEVDARTYAVATAVSEVPARLLPGNERKIASALGVFQAGVDPGDLEHRLAVERPPRMTPVMFEYELIERAKQERQHIVLPEGDDERVLRAADILGRRGVVDLTILGDERSVRGRASALGLDIDAVEVVDPVTSPLRDQFAARYHELRKHKGMTEELARDAVVDVGYFGTLMVDAGAADGMVSGAAHTTADTIRPAFEIIKAREGVSVVSSVFLMCLADRVLVYGDCAVNPNPSVEQLADIAISSAETALSFGIEPRIAMLSYSTGESGKGASVDAVREAARLVSERRPNLDVEGPIQYDAAVDAAVAAMKLPDSPVAGRATVFVFPDLETGNIAYKAVQRSAGALAVGPVLQGLRKPVNDLSRGCTVPDIVNTVVITAIQGQEASGSSTSRLRVALPGRSG